MTPPLLEPKGTGGHNLGIIHTSHIALLYQKQQNSLPRINYRVDLSHYLTDPYQIW